MGDPHPTTLKTAVEAGFRHLVQAVLNEVDSVECADFAGRGADSLRSPDFSQSNSVG